jgi:LPPG:FO 2-phospho-L-lactate transferase
VSFAVLVNTGDDFTHLGLRICPDLDTVLYTLAGVVHPEQGWGRADETFGFMIEARRQGAPDWFALGDRDLVVHVERTRRLAEGERLSVITADFAERFCVASRLLPMSDTPVATLLDTDAGRLEFRRYFVRLRREPAVRAVHFDGASQARPTRRTRDAAALAVTRGDRAVPLESVSQHRPGAGRSGHARSIACRARAGDRGLTAHRW